MKMDIGKSFTFVFEDDAWLTKILIAAAIILLGVLFSWLLLIPAILAAALINGYMVEIIRKVVGGNLDELPEWDNWGDLIVDGLKVIVIQLVYALPAIILSVCLAIPMAAISDNAEGLSVFLSVVLSCFLILWAIVVSIVLPAATAVFAATNDLGAAFRFGEVFALVRDNLSTYLITFIMSWVASFLGGLGGIVCGVGAFLTAPYGYMVTGHLYGQAYVASTMASAQPIVEEPVE
jgi:hypothetical protein